MIDWPGFLKWSLNYHDGTKPTEIPQLTSEQQQFLEKAVKSFCIDEVKRMKEILKELEENIENEEKLDQNLDLLDELIILLAALDNSKNFCKIGGIYFILKYSMNVNVDPQIRDLCFIILVDCSQNNQFVQMFLTNIDFWKIANVFEEQNWKLKLRSMSALGSMVKGDNLIMKRILLKNNGFSILIHALKQCLLEFDEHTKDKQKTAAKIMSIIDDLLKYQNFLDRDILVLKNNMDAKDHPKVNKYSEFTNFSFPHSMTLLKTLEKASILFLQNLELQSTHVRITLLRTLQSFIRECIRQKALKKKHFQKIKKYLNEYQSNLEVSVKKDDFYEQEVNQLDALFEEFNNF